VGGNGGAAAPPFCVLVEAAAARTLCRQWRTERSVERRRLTPSWRWAGGRPCDRPIIVRDRRSDNKSTDVAMPVGNCTTLTTIVVDKISCAHVA
jgi:hypothetical protein